MGGATKLEHLSGGFLALGPGLSSADAEESVRTLEAFVRMCVDGELSPEDLRLFLGAPSNRPHTSGCPSSRASSGTTRNWGHSASPP